MELHVVLIPNKETVIGQLVGEKAQIFNPKTVEAYKKMAESINKMNISCYNLTEDLVKISQAKYKIYFARDQHFMNKGHREIAKLLAKKFW